PNSEECTMNGITSENLAIFLCRAAGWCTTTAMIVAGLIGGAGVGTASAYERHTTASALSNMPALPSAPVDSPWVCLNCKEGSLMGGVLWHWFHDWENEEEAEMHATHGAESDSMDTSIR